MIAVSARRVPRFLRTFAIVAVLPISVSAQIPEASPSARRSIQATRVHDNERIAVDGRLDEEVWTRASPAHDFIQIDPASGTAATEPTEVRIAFSRDAIYMGWPRPQAVRLADVGIVIGNSGRAVARKGKRRGRPLLQSDTGCPREPDD